jgi:hypothetical protein
MNRVSPENTEIIKKGSWGKVTLVNNNTTSREDIIQRNARRGVFGVIRTFLGRYNAPSTIIDAAEFANHVMFRGVIGTNDIGLLSGMPQSKDSHQLALLMTSLHMEYGEFDRKLKDEGQPKRDYEMGLYLADTLEVIPPSLAARILFATADPETSQSNINGEKNRATEGIDILEMSVEGLVLLPNQARHDIFKELAMIQPTRDGRAHRLLSLIGADWYSHMHSKYSGYGAINANLRHLLEPAEVHQRNIHTFNDLTATRKVIEEVVGR